MLEVSDLVGDDVTADAGWREDQPPVQANPSIRRATAPARARVADGDRANRNLSRRGEFRDVARHGFQRQLPEERLDALGDAFLKPAAAQLAIHQPWSPRKSRLPDDACLHSFD